MKRLLVLILIALSLGVNGQVLLKAKHISLASTPNPTLINLASNAEMFFASGTRSLTSSFSVSVTGTPVDGKTIMMFWDGTLLTCGTYSVTVFGELLTAKQAVAKLIIMSVYKVSAWETRIISDATTVSNVGTGTGLFYRDLIQGNINLKTIKQGAGITVVNGANEVTISGTGADSTVFDAGTGIRIDSTENRYVIINITQDSTTVANAGTGTGQVYKSMTGNQINLKTIKQGTGITVTNNTSDVTLTNAAPEQTVVITGAGINTVTGTHPNFVVRGTEVDGSITNELQLLTVSSTPTPTITLSNTGGDILLEATGGMTISTSSGTVTFHSPPVSDSTVKIGTPPIVVTTSGDTTIISSTKATTSDSGYIIPVDWNRFNNKLDGTGTINYMPKYKAVDTLQNSQVFDDGTVVRIGNGEDWATRLDVHGGLKILVENNIDGTMIHQAQTKYHIGTTDSVIWIQHAADAQFSITRYTNTLTPASFFVIGSDGHIVLSPGTGQNYQLPITHGTAGQLLTSAGYGGAFTWTTPSVLSNDSMLWYRSGSRGSMYLRNVTDRVSIGSNSTANTNRRFHVQGSQYLKDTLFYESGTYLTDIGNELYSNYGANLSFLTVRNLGNDVEPDSIVTVQDGEFHTTPYLSATGASLDSLAWYRNATRGYIYPRTLTDKVGIGLNNGTEQFQITKNFRLPQSTDSLTGVIKKAGTWFMHDFGTASTFLGLSAGNFSMSGTTNTGVGWKSLNETTAGDNNTAVGSSSGMHLTTGDNNTLIGSVAGYYNTIGNRNTSVGDHAGAATEGNDNVSIGYQAGYGVIGPKTGHGNVAIGSQALYKIQAGYDNIAIGDSASRELDTKHNTIAIGAGVEPTASDQAILGNSSITTTILRGTVNMNNTPAGTAVSTLGIDANGDAVKFTPIDSAYRYRAYGSPLGAQEAGYTNVEVLATSRGITATYTNGNTFTFTIPAGVRLISAKFRLTGAATMVVYLDDSDMGNTSMLDRWMPVVQGWREDTGNQLTGMTVKMEADFTKITVNGLVSTTPCHIRFGF